MAARLPTFSLITPSYQQAEFLEATLRSVLEQDYPPVEYLVFDGGSTDGSVDILRRYGPRLTLWESGPDGGQTHALNKGLLRVTGDYVAYLNSDDLFYPGALRAVAEAIARHGGQPWVAAACAMGANPAAPAFVKRPLPVGFLDYFGFAESGLAQPACFWPRALFEKLGRFDESLHCIFDFEFIARCLYYGYQPLLLTEVTTSFFRLHPASKTVGAQARFTAEHARVLQQWAPRLPGRWQKQLAAAFDRYYSGAFPEEIYPVLLKRGRWAAAVQLVRLLPELRRLRPAKQYWGAWARVLGSGRPPAWYGQRG